MANAIAPSGPSVRSAYANAVITSNCRDITLVLSMVMVASMALMLPASLAGTQIRDNLAP